MSPKHSVKSKSFPGLDNYFLISLLLQEFHDHGNPVLCESKNKMTEEKVEKETSLYKLSRTGIRTITFVLYMR